MRPAKGWCQQQSGTGLRRARAPVAHPTMFAFACRRWVTSERRRRAGRAGRWSAWASLQVSSDCRELEALRVGSRYKRSRGLEKASVHTPRLRRLQVCKTAMQHCNAPHNADCPCPGPAPLSHRLDHRKCGNRPRRARYGREGFLLCSPGPTCCSWGSSSRPAVSRTAE